MQKENITTFDSYSKYYNLLYFDKDYRAECGHIDSLIQKFKPETKTILELGCGTGRHGKILSESYDVFGIDLSETMLKYAKDLGFKCELGDVRTYRNQKKYDAVLSLFHVASYQTTQNDIKNFFKTAAAHLKQSGIFTFDLWHKEAVLSQLPEKRVKELENSELRIKRYCEPVHLKEKNVVDVNYKIEITNKANGSMQVIQEKHSMRYFDTEEIRQLAKNENIEIIYTGEWLSGDTPSSHSWGVCYVGVKK